MRVKVQVPDPSREELITQIVDVIDQAKPKPSRKEQTLSVVTSILVRTACVAYSAYLAFLFATKYAMHYGGSTSDQITSNDRALVYGLLGFLLYMIYRKVYGDRFTPAMNMVRQIIFRFAKIVITFLFWNLIFSWLTDLKDSFMSMVATIFIIGSGYDFRLRDRGAKTPNPLSS